MTTPHTFIMSLNVDSDAFTPEPWDELARILRECADRLEQDRESCRWFQTVRDINGNDVGRFAVKHADYLKSGA